MSSVAFWSLKKRTLMMPWGNLSLWDKLEVQGLNEVGIYEAGSG